MARPKLDNLLFVTFVTSLISVAGWFGAWLGSPVFGYWPHQFPILNYQNIWFIPAILGAIAAVGLAVDFDKRARHAIARG
jgi:uncharacterized membrane protein YeaQ/YmgE (transglycosylase-associated protein family)